VTFECLECPKEIKEQHCISDGAFCFTPPSQERANQYPQLTDKQLIKENLRQRCIYSVLAEEPDEFDSHIFLNYLFNMHLMCLQMDKELTYECAHRNMRNLEIPIERVDECMSNSFEQADNWESYNMLLAEDRDAANNLGVAMSPSISINGLMYHDELRAENIFG